MGEPVPGPRRRTVRSRRRAARRACCSTTHPTTCSRSAARRCRAPRSSGSTTRGGASTCSATSSTRTAGSSSPSRATRRCSSRSPASSRRCSSRTGIPRPASPTVRPCSTDDLDDALSGVAHRRPGDRARPRHVVGADLHVGDVRRAEGGDLHAAPVHGHRQPDGDHHGSRADDVGYVCMPLFHSNALMVGWAPSIVYGASVGLGAPVQRVAAGCPTSATTAPRTSTTRASRSRTSCRRPSGPTTPTTRCGSRSATRGHPRSSTRSPAASAST